MTNTEKALVILCMIMVMMFSLSDILTLYDSICWELGAELSVFAVSSIMCYMTITEKI